MSSGLELRHLRYFAVLAEHLHFGQAAKALNMAQPPLSQQIQRLERTLGIELFDRSSRHVELTESGRILLEVARDVLGRADHLEHLAESLREGEAGTVRLGFVATAMNWGLSARLRVFRAEYPNADVTATQMQVVDQVAALQEGTIDLAFTMARLNIRDLVVADYAEEPLQAILPSDHRLAGDSAIALSELADDDFISFRGPSEDRVEDFISVACHQAGFIPRLTFQGAQTYTLMHMVGAGFGVSLLPACDANMRAHGVVFVPLKAPVPMCRLSVVRTRRLVSPLTARLVEIVTGRPSGADHATAADR